MDPKTIVRLTLAFGRAFLATQGETEAVEYIDQVRDAYNAGANVDRHLQAIAEFLDGGGVPDFPTLRSELQAEVDEFLART